MAHPNEDLLRKGYDAFNAGDIDTVKSLFAPDIVGHFGGKSQLAGDYKGVDEVIGALAKLVELSGGTFKETVHDIVANDTHAVALGEVTAQRDGKTYDQKSVEVYHVNGGKVTEFWDWIEDQDADKDFWG